MEHMTERLYQATAKDRKHLQIALTVALANGVASLGVPYRAVVDPLGGTEYHFDTVPGGVQVSVAGGFIHSRWGDHKAVGLPHWKQNQHVFIDGKLTKAEREWKLDNKPQEAVANVLRLVTRHAGKGNAAKPAPVATVRPGTGTAAAPIALKATGTVARTSYIVHDAVVTPGKSTYDAELTKQGDVYLADHTRRRWFIGTADHIKGGVMAGAERWEARRPDGASAPVKADFVFVDKQYQSRAAQAFPPKNQAIQWLVDQSGMATAQPLPKKVQAPVPRQVGITGVQLFNAVEAIMRADPETRDTAMWMNEHSHRVLVEFNKTADAINAKRAKAKPAQKPQAKRTQALGDWSGGGRYHKGDKVPLQLVGGLSGPYGAALLVGEASRFIATSESDATALGFTGRNFRAVPKDAFGSFSLIRSAGLLDWLAFGQILRSGANKELHKTPQDWYEAVRTACGRNQTPGIPTIATYYSAMVSESGDNFLPDVIEDAVEAEDAQDRLAAMYIGGISGISGANAMVSWSDPTGEPLQSIVISANDKRLSSDGYDLDVEENIGKAVHTENETVYTRWFKSRGLTLPGGDHRYSAYDKAQELAESYLLVEALAINMNKMLRDDDLKEREAGVHARAWRDVRAATGVPHRQSPYYARIEPEAAAIVAKQARASWKKVGGAYVKGDVSIAKTGRGNTAWIRTTKRIGGGPPYETGHPTLKAAKEG
jgi:hypothetical protein